MLKGFNELVQIDVLPFCDKRKAKDDSGKPIEVPYLPWAKCKMLLHENGANEVYFVPLKNETGGYLFQSKEVHDKNGRTTGCYFVSVEIHIDDKTFRMDMPLMNGSLRERGQEPIKTEYSRQGRFQQETVCQSGFCLKIFNFPKSRARKIERKTALLREQRQRDSKTDSGNQWSR